MTSSIPSAVTVFVQSIVRKPRTSPPLDDSQVESISTKAGNLASSDELTIQRNLLSTSMFPQMEDYPNSIKNGGDTPSTTSPLPLD